jgi:hypothetical protein
MWFPMSKSATHPYIGFLVGEMKEILYLINQNPGLALENMIMILHSVDLRARQKGNWSELDSELFKAYQGRKSIRNSDPTIQHSQIMKYDHDSHKGYIGCYSKLWQVLWDNGYMDERTYSTFWDPSGGRKSGEGDHEGFPSRVKVEF